jgi:transposase
MQAFPTHPDAAWWQTIPGAQSLTGARLLAWIGDDRGRFPTANTLQATAGTVPVTRRSGKSKSVEFRKGCSHKLRKAADDLARQSVKKSNWAQEYYDAQIAAWTRLSASLPRFSQPVVEHYLEVVANSGSRMTSRCIWQSV